jgi:hypothetical protein
VILRIDHKDLENYISKHSNEIGKGDLPSWITNLVAGVFLIPSAWSVGNNVVKSVLLCCALAYCLWTACRIVKIIKNPFDANKLLKGVETMDRTKRRSSIIALRDATGEFKNRYLLYRDDGWGCDFFPNHKTADPTSLDQQQITDYISNTFGIPKESFDLAYVGHDVSEKKSTEHNDELRYYDYQLYSAEVKDIPDSWKDASFKVGSKRCKWMSIDEMLSDDEIKKTNYDVVSMVRDKIV